MNLSSYEPLSFLQTPLHLMDCTHESSSSLSENLKRLSVLFSNYPSNLWHSAETSKYPLKIENLTDLWNQKVDYRTEYASQLTFSHDTSTEKHPPFPECPREEQCKFARFSTWERKLEYSDPRSSERVDPIRWVLHDLRDFLTDSKKGGNLWKGEYLSEEKVTLKWSWKTSQQNLISDRNTNYTL